MLRIFSDSTQEAETSVEAQNESLCGLRQAGSQQLICTHHCQGAHPLTTEKATQRIKDSRMMTGSAYGTSIVSQYTTPAYRTQVGKGVAALQLEKKEVEEVRVITTLLQIIRSSSHRAYSRTIATTTHRRCHKSASKSSIDCPTGRLLPSARGVRCSAAACLFAARDAQAIPRFSPIAVQGLSFRHTAKPPSDTAPRGPA